MIILTIRTDKPEAELGLYDGHNQLGYERWEAHRQLAETIHDKMSQLLSSHKISWHDVQGIIVYKGPGSFTGLRIGLSAANALAGGLEVPIVATTEDWIEEGIELLESGNNHQVALPEYGAPAHTTVQKK